MGLDKSLINGFEKYSGNVEECLMRLLDIYMNDKSPSMEEICKAVKLVSFANLSEDLRKKYEGIQQLVKYYLYMFSCMQVDISDGFLMCVNIP